MKPCHDQFLPGPSGALWRGQGNSRAQCPSPPWSVSESLGANSHAMLVSKRTQHQPAWINDNECILKELKNDVGFIMYCTVPHSVATTHPSRKLCCSHILKRETMQLTYVPICSNMFQYDPCPSQIFIFSVAKVLVGFRMHVSTSNAWTQSLAHPELKMYAIETKSTGNPKATHFERPTILVQYRTIVYHTIPQN